MTANPDPEGDLLEDDPGIYLDLLTERDEAIEAAGRARDALAVEHEIQRLMLERLGLEWTPGEPFYALVEDEIKRSREVTRIAQEYARTIYAAAEKYQSERDDLRAENERLRETIAEWQEIHGTFTGDVHAACQAEIGHLRMALEWVRDNTELWDAPVVLEALRAGAQG